MTRRLRRRHGCPVSLARVMFALAMLAAVPGGTSAQGCSMCRETAAFQKDRALGALQRGIAVLAIPPAGIAAGLAWFTWKRSRRFASD